MTSLPILLLFYLLKGSFSNDDAIPDSLVKCYESNLRLRPMSIQSLIDIIRKIELNETALFSTRTLTSILLQRFWFDGIERDPRAVTRLPQVIPFRPSGFQKHRYSLLHQYFLPKVQFYFNNLALSTEEECSLHFMLSSTVDKWERGDEYKTCPALAHFQQQWKEWSGTKLSTCPIEMGVVEVGQYAISPGKVLATIFSGIEPVNSNVETIRNFMKFHPGHNLTKDTQLDSTLIVAIASDLAEVVVNQVGQTNMFWIGGSGIWNDTTIPTNYFLMSKSYSFIEKQFWQFTDAEIIGGIDGMILSDVERRWRQFGNNLKLSQLFELYYIRQQTNSGLPSPCVRLTFYHRQILPRGPEIIDQALEFSRFLIHTSPSLAVEDDVLKESVERAFYSFEQTASVLLSEGKCESIAPQIIQKLSFILIFDSTWPPYYTLTLLMKIAKLIDVSPLGSRISVLNGQTGKIIVKNAHTISDLYLSWINSPDFAKDTEFLELSSAFLGLKYYFEQEKNSSCSPEQINEYSLGQVVLIVGHSSQLSDKDVSTASTILKNIYFENKDLTVYYAPSESSDVQFKALLQSKVGWSTSKVLIKDKSIDYLITDLQHQLQSVSRSLRPYQCCSYEALNVYIEYLTPQRLYNFTIHPNYVCKNQMLSIKVETLNQGEVEACFEDENTSCNFIRNNSTKFTTRSKDKIVNLKLIGKSNFHYCQDVRCRQLNEIKVLIQVEGLKCISEIDYKKYVCKNFALNSFTNNLKLLGLSLILIYFH